METPDGIRYILRTSGNEPSNVALGLAFALRIPLVAAGLAVWFLSQHFRQVSPILTGLAGLFVAQMLYAARLPWNLLRLRLWHQLIARFGHGEIELSGERLFSGNRVGIFRSGQNRDVREIQKIVVYVYADQSPPPSDREPTRNGTLNDGYGRSRAADAPDGFPDDRAAAAVGPQDEPVVTAQEGLESPERAVLAIEAATRKSPWLLVDGFSRTETLTLAEDLHRRIAVFLGRHASQSPPPRPAVIETDVATLYPPLAPDFYRRREPLWLAIHVAGSGGLAALTAIAIHTGAWQISSVKVTILFGWLLEMLLVVGTLLLPGGSETKSPSE